MPEYDKMNKEQAARAEAERARKSLEESEATYRAIGESIPFGVWITGADGRVIYLSDSFLRLTGMSLQECREKSWAERLEPREAERMREAWERCLRAGDFWEYEFKLTCVDGQERFILSRGIPIRDESGRVLRWAGLNMDITGRKVAEKALEAEKERLAVILAGIREGVIAVDKRGVVVFCSAEAERLTEWGQEEAVGRPVAEVMRLSNKKTGEAYKNPVGKLSEAAKGAGLYEDIVLTGRKGVERLVSGEASPIYGRDGAAAGTVLVFRDITERRFIEQELMKAQKLESIGVLAGGIAHDFNNLLSVVLGNIELARETTPSGDAYDRLVEAEKAVNRAKGLSRQLLTFSREGAPVKEIAYIDEIIRETAGFVLHGANVSCEFSISDGLWLVEVDEGQISQTFNNIIINAVQAMPEGGEITVRCENAVIEEKDLVPLPPGRYVRISISDTGTGIPPENITKIFDPFFTTRLKGSGLGLTMAYSIVKGHGGHISVESKPGEGSTFRVYIPASAYQKRVMEKPVEEAMPGGCGRILIMDDEEMVRKVAGAILEKVGCKVDYAKDGAEAVSLYRSAWDKGRPYDAVLLDLTVAGGMGGKEAIKRLKEINPAVKAVVASGYSFDPIMSEYSKYGFEGAVVKPFKIAELRKAISDMIKGGQ